MALIVEFAVPTAKFALSETLTAVPDATLEIGRVVAEPPESITAYIWAHAADFDALETAFEDDPTVTSFTVLSEATDERSYRMTWTEPVDLLVHIMTKQEGTIIHGTNNADTWALRVSFPERGAIVRAQELMDLAQQNEFSLEVRKIHQTNEYWSMEPQLTDQQRELLVTAFKAGYFKVPKEVTLKELAERQGVSHQAISEQIRRGVHHLIEQTLLVSDSEDQEDR